MCDFKATDPEPMQAIVSHYRDHFEILSNEEGKIVISNLNALPEENSDHYYFDHFAKKKYKVSHYPLELREISDFECEDDEIVQALGKALQKYLEEFFGENSALLIVKTENGYEIVYTSKIKNKTSK